jgi:hypothetical protein
VGRRGADGGRCPVGPQTSPVYERISCPLLPPSSVISARIQSRDTRSRSMDGRVCVPEPAWRSRHPDRISPPHHPRSGHVGRRPPRIRPARRDHPSRRPASCRLLGVRWQASATATWSFGCSHARGDELHQGDASVDTRVRPQRSLNASSALPGFLTRAHFKATRAKYGPLRPPSPSPARRKARADQKFLSGVRFKLQISAEA